jgi:hypothetical protein
VGIRGEEKREQPRNLPQMHVHETAAAPEADPVSPLAISLFGPFEVRLRGQPLLQGPVAAGTAPEDRQSRELSWEVKSSRPDTGGVPGLPFPP